MTNKEYLDFLIVCNKLNTKGIEQYLDRINKSDINVIELIKIGLSHRDRQINSLFFSLNTLIKGFEHRRNLVDTVIPELIKIYFSYEKYKTDYHSNWFFFNMLLNDIGLELTHADCNVQYALNEFRIIDVDDTMIFCIDNEEYKITFSDSFGFSFHGRDEVIKNISGVCLKDNGYKVIKCIDDIESMEKGGYEIVLVCMDKELRYCDDITHKLLSNK